MTTIAYRDGILAADTLAVSTSHFRAGRIIKIVRAPGGELLATTGFAPTAFDIREWYLNGCEGEQPVSEHVGSLIVFSAETIDIYCGGGRQTEGEAEFYAYGAGAELAIGAMAMGATAEEAVSVAARFNIYTGGDITVLHVAAPKPQ